MTAFIFKSSISMVLFFALYWLFLRKEKLFTFNRFYLIFSVLISLAVPFISLKIDLGEKETSNGLITALYSVPDAVSPDDETPAAPETAADRENYRETETSYIARPETGSGSNSISLPGILLLLYFSGLALMVLRFCRNIFLLIQKFRKSEKIDNEWYKIALVESPVSPFSFYRTIYVNRQDYLQNKIAGDIISHESEHIRQGHTLDILFFEITGIIYWFNPVLIFYSREARINHEYLADEAVANNYSDVSSYANELITFISRRVNIPLTSGFSPSMIRLRLLMLNTRSNRLLNRVRILGTFVVSALLFITLSMKPAYRTPQSPEDTTFATMQDTTEQKMKYTADSILEDPVNKRVILLSSVRINIGTTEITGDSVSIDMKTKVLYAFAKKDTSGKTIEKVVLKQNDQIIRTDDLTYYYETGKFHVKYSFGTVIGPNRQNEANPVIKDVNFRGPDFKSRRTLVVLDGRSLEADEMMELDPDMIKSINILEDKEAKAKYGRKAKKGALEICTYASDKRSVPDSSDYKTFLTVNDKRPETLKIPVSNLYSAEIRTYPLIPNPTRKKQWKMIDLMTRDFYTIRGKVVAKNGEPVPGVRLDAANNNLKVRTDLNGNFLMEDVITRAVVELSAEGYKTLHFTATGEVFTNDLTITLEKKDEPDLSMKKPLNRSIRDFSGTWKYNSELSKSLFPKREEYIYRIRQYDSDSIIFIVIRKIDGRMINSTRKFLLNTINISVDKSNRKYVTSCFIDPGGQSFTVSHQSSSIIGLPWEYNSFETYSLSDDGNQLILRSENYRPAGRNTSPGSRIEELVHERM